MHAHPQLKSIPETRPQLWASSLWELMVTHWYPVIVLMTVVGTFYLLGIMPVLMLMIYAVAAWLVICHPDDFLENVSKAWLLLLFPLICFISTLWSVDPQATLKNSIQLLYSGVIGIAIGMRFRLNVVFNSLAIAMVVCVLLSTLNIFIEVVPAYKQDDYVGAERYFLGMYPQKNMMGGVLYLCALGLCYLGLVWKRPFLMYIPALALLPLLLQTKSATALLFYLIALSMPVSWWFYTRVKVKTVLIVSAVVFVVAALFLAIAFDIPLIDKFLAAFGKERTLTGRTVIWATAFDIFDKAPIIGVGYQAFWTAPAYSGEVQMIRAAILDTISGFHNGHLEVLVAVGLVGLMSYWAMILVLFVVCIRNFTAEPTPMSLLSLYYVGLTLIKSFTESALCFQHDIDYLMFCVIMVASVVETVEREEKNLNYLGRELMIAGSSEK